MVHHYLQAVELIKPAEIQFTTSSTLTWRSWHIITAQQLNQYILIKDKTM
jgi:hypothetical protein